ncbi:8-oxo-dGDP phosphatase NUDT18-like [Chiloscyllium plagiosum]|uniref:8-oxo-dGDP phosphatase NUDT18-like n=1 Tax=Chiloscyllium plagiosum TaxID=36176 RepID=UPI001CB832F6|nr:8-oxo-dGDP phosphatase NUDT18-like [Chiloscyllium plagiosum]
MQGALFDSFIRLTPDFQPRDFLRSGVNVEDFQGNCFLSAYHCSTTSAVSALSVGQDVSSDGYGDIWAVVSTKEQQLKGLLSMTTEKYTGERLWLWPKGRVTGGTLKSTSESDAESLQAKWWDRVSPLPLRARDILNLISIAVKYKEKASHPVTVPIEMSCSLVCHRVLAAFLNKNNDLWLLASNQEWPHFPVTACGSSSAELSCSVEVAIYRLSRECLREAQLRVKTHGILSLQHTGAVPGKADGVCFNVLVTIAPLEGTYSQSPPDVSSVKYSWYQIDNDDLKIQLLERLSFASVVPFLN